MLHPSYKDIVEKAQQTPEFWRIGVALVTVFALTTVGTPVILGLLGRTIPEIRPIFAEGETLQIGATPGGLFVIFAGFSLLFLVSLRLARRLHGRTLRDLTGPARAMRFDALIVARWVLGITVVTMFLPWDTVDIEFTKQLSVTVWLAWMPLGILGLSMQVCAEEVFFRGYLQSQLIASTRSYTKGIVLSALLFGLAHYSGQVEGAASLLPVIWAMAFGLMVGDLTARTGNLGPAIAIHFLNNAMALFFAPLIGNLSGFGLWLRETEIAQAYSDPKLMVYEGLMLLITWLVARIALKR